MGTRKLLHWKSSKMEELLINLIDKIIELLGISRVRRRELLIEVLTPIYNNLKEIHREYLIELSVAKEQCADVQNLRKMLTQLEKKRILREPERQEIKALSERLIAKKWRPEVKKFLESSNNYFQLSVPLIILLEYSTLPGSEIHQHIQCCTGYSRVIEVLRCLIEGKHESEYAQKVILDILDETLNSLRMVWDKVSLDFAELRARST